MSGFRVRMDVTPWQPVWLEGPTAFLQGAMETAPATLRKRLEFVEAALTNAHKVFEAEVAGLHGIITDMRFRAERAEMRAEIAENDLAALKVMH